LDVSTRDDAERILGKAVKEDGARLFLDYAGRYFRPGIATSLPSLSYKKVQGMAGVDLFFEDGTLAAIALVPHARTIDAASLPEIYGVAFERQNTLGESLLGERSMSSGHQYRLGAFTDQVVLLADIASPQFFNNKNAGEFPGSVMRIQMISRRLGRPAKGSDLLK
jgi:hypothetical protein